MSIAFVAIVAAAVAIVAAPGCGTPKVNHLPDACVSSAANTMTVTGPDSYVCHAPFMASFTVTNNGCDDLSITSFEVTGVVTGGDSCTPPPDSTYPHSMTVSPGETKDVFDLTGGMFCCFTMACPAEFQCDEEYTYTATTSAGMLTAMGSAHLDLDSCDQICQ